MATGHFNYVNHVVAGHLHVNGPVTGVSVVALAPDGTPQTARLSGTCDQFLPSCTFSVLTEDHGEPAVNDRFGVTVVSAGQVVEARALRVVRNGNIQFHDATLTTTLNAASLAVGQTIRLRVRLRGDDTNTPADAYLVLRLPSGQLLSWTGGGLVPGLVPIARNFVPMNLDLEVLALAIPPGTPPGVYTWMTALTEAGTLNLLTGDLRAVVHDPAVAATSPSPPLVRITGRRRPAWPNCTGRPASTLVRCRVGRGWRSLSWRCSP